MKWQKIKEKWPKLSEEDFESAEGRVDILARKIQEQYGDSLETIESMLEELLDT